MFDYADRYDDQVEESPIWRPLNDQMDESDDDSVLYSTKFLAAHIPHTRTGDPAISHPKNLTYESVEPLLQQLCKRAHNASSGHHGLSRTIDNIKLVLANEFPTQFIHSPVSYTHLTLPTICSV